MIISNDKFFLTAIIVGAQHLNHIHALRGYLIIKISYGAAGAVNGTDIIDSRNATNAKIKSVLFR